MAGRRDESVRSRLLDVMKRGGKEAYSTSELTRRGKFSKSSEINPTLYSLQKEGVVKKIQERSPPTWQLVNRRFDPRGVRSTNNPRGPGPGLWRGTGRGRGVQWQHTYRREEQALAKRPFSPPGQSNATFDRRGPDYSPSTQLPPCLPNRGANSSTAVQFQPSFTGRGPPSLPPSQTPSAFISSGPISTLSQFRSQVTDRGAGPSHSSQPTGQIPEPSSSSQPPLINRQHSSSPSKNEHHHQPQQQNHPGASGDLRSRLLDLLTRSRDRNRTALELAKELGFESRKSVNPTLYNLEKEGCVERIEGKGPPMWRLSAGDKTVGSGQTLSSTAQHPGQSLKMGQLGESPPALAPFSAPSSFSHEPPVTLHSPRYFSTPAQSSSMEMEMDHHTVVSNDNDDVMDLDSEVEGKPLYASIDLSHIPVENVHGRIMAVLGASESMQLTDLELANAIGGNQTRNSLRPYLEELAQANKVEKSKSFPVTWRLVELQADREIAQPPVSAPIASAQQSSTIAVPTSAMSSLNIASLVDMSRNPVTVLSEHCQAKKLELNFLELKEFGAPHQKTFVIAASFGGLQFEAQASNKKEARRMAADLALQHLMQEQVIPVRLDSSASVPNTSADFSLGGSSSVSTFHDRVAKMSHDFYVQVQSSVEFPQPGRKVIAAFLMEDTNTSEMHVVSVSSGTRCITGDHMSLDGFVVNDSHAEVIARRSLVRFFYRQLAAEFRGSNDTIFTKSEGHGQALVRVKDNFKFHLYISTAPCGDGAQFSRNDNANQEPPLEGKHVPTMTGKAQGVLRTKMEGGEGTIPIGDAQPQTWDGILTGGRLRTMSCSDKVGRWNILGLQGALLTHFMEPVYMSSLTLGSLHHHGHLSRAVCCRFSDLDASALPPGYRVNHAALGRTQGGDGIKRHTEKTSNFSLNWAYDDDKGELNDGGVGRPVLPVGAPKSQISASCSRLCKLSLLSEFLSLCEATGRLEMVTGKSYKALKEMAGDYQKAKQLLYDFCHRKGYGRWMKKPVEQELFDSATVERLNNSFC